jgi:cytochrome c-type biogenesis protein CcmE
MKRSLSLLLTLLCMGVMLAFAAERVAVSALLKDADKYDGKAITLTGTVADFKQKTSKRGNDYFTFKLKDKSEVVNIYGQGKLEKAPKDGDKVEVTGRYAKEKKQGDVTFKNELNVTVDKSKEDTKNFGVKIL